MEYDSSPNANRPSLPPKSSNQNGKPPTFCQSVPHPALNEGTRPSCAHSGTNRMALNGGTSHALNVNPLEIVQNLRDLADYIEEAEPSNSLDYAFHRIQEFSFTKHKANLTRPSSTAPTSTGVSVSLCKGRRLQRYKSIVGKYRCIESPLVLAERLRGIEMAALRGAGSPVQLRATVPSNTEHMHHNQGEPGANGSAKPSVNPAGITSSEDSDGTRAQLSDLVEELSRVKQHQAVLKSQEDRLMGAIQLEEKKAINQQLSEEFRKVSKLENRLNRAQSRANKLRDKMGLTSDHHRSQSPLHYTLPDLSYTGDCSYTEKMNELNRRSKVLDQDINQLTRNATVDQSNYKQSHTDPRIPPYFKPVNYR